MNFLAFLDEMWFSSNGNCTQILRRVFQVKELPVYFQEAIQLRKSATHGRVPLPLLLLALRRWLSLPPSHFRFPHGLQFGMLRSFLLTMCMLAPESTTNSLSSGLIVDAAGIIHSSQGE